MTLLQPYRYFHVATFIACKHVAEIVFTFQCLTVVFDVPFCTSLHYITVRRTYRSLDQFCEPVDASSDAVDASSDAVDASSDALSSSIFDLQRVSCWVTRDNMYLLCNIYFISFPPRSASIHAQQVYAFACDNRFIIESSCNFEL